MAQIADDKLSWQYNEETNSIATIVKHLNGNMLSRWTDFMTTDGEKEWRQRDAEFARMDHNVEDEILLREILMKKWNEGWACLYSALDSLKEEDLQKEIFIRKEGLTVMDAVNRQLAHYSYHVGQIVFIGKMIVGEKWNSLSIPKKNE